MPPLNVAIYCTGVESIPLEAADFRYPRLAGFIYEHNFDETGDECEPNDDDDDHNYDADEDDATYAD
jgi:hypothetical protein